MALVNITMAHEGLPPYTKLVSGTIVKGVIGIHRDLWNYDYWQLTHIPTGYRLVGRLPSRKLAFRCAARILALAGDHDLTAIPASQDKRRQPRWFRQLDKQLRSEIHEYRPLEALQ